MTGEFWYKFGRILGNRTDNCCVVNDLHKGSVKATEWIQIMGRDVEDNKETSANGLVLPKIQARTYLP